MVRRVYNSIQNLILILAVCVLLLLAFSVTVYKTVPGVVVSGSMEPEIPKGCICFIDGRNRSPARGDIVSFKEGRMIVTHRVVEIVDDGYITKGDSNSYSDSGIVAPEKIIGKYAFCIPKAGFAVMMLKTPRGVILVATILAVFVLAGVCIRICDARRMVKK